MHLVYVRLYDAHRAYTSAVVSLKNSMVQFFMQYSSSIAGRVQIHQVQIGAYFHSSTLCVVGCYSSVSTCGCEHVCAAISFCMISS
jgi:hypothetical protein